MTISTCCNSPVKANTGIEKAGDKTYLYCCRKCGSPCSTIEASVEADREGKPLEPFRVIITAPKGFRCFVPATKQMLYPEQLADMNVMLTAEGVLVILKDGALVKAEGLIPLWRTAQMDSTGRQIYEGDFAELEIQTGLGIAKRIAVMRFVPETHQFTFVFNGKGMFGGRTETLKVTVIGNEYQDKDAALRYHEDNEEL